VDILTIQNTQFLNSEKNLGSGRDFKNNDKLLNGYRVPVWDDRKILELNYGDII
jgi:hypothetical protein